MFDHRLRALEGELTRRPENLEAWREVADLVRRTGQLPAWVDPARDLPALHELWAVTTLVLYGDKVSLLLEP